MGLEIRPAQVGANLQGVNQALSSILSSSITPIGPAISDFVRSRDLNSHAFDNLRGHMDANINSGLLEQCKAAIDALKEANNQHLQALGGLCNTTS